MQNAECEIDGCVASYTVSVALRRQLFLAKRAPFVGVADIFPDTGKSTSRGRQIYDAKLLKRLPLEGKLSSERETDEVASDNVK